MSTNYLDTRTFLDIARLPQSAKDYIAALELEVSRPQQRSKAHRQNIRSMQAKLRVANLQRDVRELHDAYAQQASYIRAVERVS